MPAYNFKSRFADAVESGTKRQTIRKPRKRPTKVGETLKLYTGQRTPECRLLREETCLGVYPVDIYVDCVCFDRQWLSVEQTRELAQRDGFADEAAFFKFFRDTYDLKTGEVLSMELIQW